MASYDVAISICELTLNMGPAKKMVLIMDEVDGMSGGDRGGVAELIQCIKLSKVGPLQILLPTSSS